MPMENLKSSKSDFELIVSDVKQYAYCPRIPYYHYALPVEKRATFKMEHGKERHVDLQRLESRRKLRRYQLEGGERLFGVWLRSARLGLAGRLDLLIRTTTADYPVEFKHTEGGVAANHRLQLLAYGLLVEERYGRPVERGFVYLLPKDDVQIVEFSAEDREAVRLALSAIRESVLSERMPAATSIRSRCMDCEFRNYCADVF
jgi:CRISPR-associated exonuclease Cas4